MATFRIEPIDTDDPTRAVLKAVGAADGNMVDLLQEALNEQLNRGVLTIVLDMGQVEYISSSGVRALVAAHDTAKERGGALSITNPSANVRYIFEITGLGNLFASS